jgi:hypothetical protein
MANAVFVSMLEHLQHFVKLIPKSQMYTLNSSCVNLTTTNRMTFFLPLQEIDDLLAGVLTPEDEEAVEEELEKIIKAEMPEVPQEEPAAGEPAMPDVPTEPGMWHKCFIVTLPYYATILCFVQNI